MKKKAELERLLKTNPKARKQEAVVKEALRDIEKLRRHGLAERDYSLLPPFGEKRQSLQRSNRKLTLFA